MWDLHKKRKNVSSCGVWNQNFMRLLYLSYYQIKKQSTRNQQVAFKSPLEDHYVCVCRFEVYNLRFLFVNCAIVGFLYVLYVRHIHCILRVFFLQFPVCSALLMWVWDCNRTVDRTFHVFYWIKFYVASIQVVGIVNPFSKNFWNAIAHFFPHVTIRLICGNPSFSSADHIIVSNLAEKIS